MPTNESKSGFFTVDEVIEDDSKCNEIRDGKTLVGILLLFGARIGLSMIFMQV